MPPDRHDNFRSPAALSRFLLTAAIGLSLDLWTKVLAFNALMVHMVNRSDESISVESRTVQFVHGLLSFEVTANKGAVFGLGQGQRLLFVAVSIGATAFLFYLFSTSGRQRIYQVVLGMLLAGVLGNMYDRVVHGYVRDMIHALPGVRWPAFVASVLPSSLGNNDVFPWIFNVADMLLCCGVAMIAMHWIFAQHETGDAPEGLSKNPARP